MFGCLVGLHSHVAVPVLGPQRRLTSERCCLQVPSCVDVEFLFGNMEEIADVSQRLLTSLESAISGKAFQDQIVGRLCTPF